jgi:hypothetical protein
MPKGATQKYRQGMDMLNPETKKSDNGKGTGLKEKPEATPVPKKKGK